MTPEERIQTVLRETQPLKHARGERLPLYIWQTMNVPGDEAQVEKTLKALAERGIGACSTWIPGKRQAASLEQALRVARVQKKLGLRVNINAIRCTYSVFDGSKETAHVDADGKPFFDLSCSPKKKLGCPFRIKGRYAPMREQVESFVRAYKQAHLPIDFVFTDWEIDGPIEWNDGWAAAKRCVTCRKHIGDVNDFLAVQKAYRKIRTETQRECYARPVLDHFPKALVGNYAVYPSGKWRYWYDYFEKEAGPGVPVKMDQRAPYRPWPNEFDGTDFTFAMPVVYTWSRLWNWYDWADGDFRWFYNMLLVASNAGRHAPASLALIPFVHYTTIQPDLSPGVKQMGTEAYKELLWHMLLRGHDTFFLWCPDGDLVREIRPLHQVWAAALEYKEFLDKGEPVTFDVPAKPGPVVSALRLGDRLLVRRTEFGGMAGPVMLKVGDKSVAVPRVPGASQVIELP